MNDVTGVDTSDLTAKRHLKTEFNKTDIKILVNVQKSKIKSR